MRIDRAKCASNERKSTTSHLQRSKVTPQVEINWIRNEVTSGNTAINFNKISPILFKWSKRWTPYNLRLERTVLKQNRVKVNGSRNNSSSGAS